MVGGTGSGKTWLAPHWVYKQLKQKPRSTLMAIGMQYERHIVNLMQRQMTDFLDEIGEPYKLVQGKRILFTNCGSRILFGSAERPESLEGPHLDAGVWMDEAGLMPRLAWDVATRRSGQKEVPILITTIPYYPDWLKTDVYDAAMKGDPDITWIHCRSIDNPNYPLAEIARRKRVMRPEKFKTYYLGEFAQPYGGIYPEPDDDEVVVEPFVIPDHWPAYAGHDWGWTAPTTGIWARHDVDTDTLYVVAEYERHGQSIQEHLGQWQADGLDFLDKAWGDSANPEQWASIAKYGYKVDPVIKGEKSVNYGINVVYERLKGNRLKFFRGCHRVIDLRKRYIWASSPTDDELLLEEPKKPQEAEHLMDALRYLCVGMVDSGLAAGPPELSVERTHLSSAA